MALASIPSPSSAVWRLGPLPVRAYGLCVAAGIVVAVAVASRRYRRSGGRRGVMLDVAAWAVPFGLIGAAAHALLVATRHDFTHAYRLWHAVTLGVAAIGVPGAVALGAAGAWIACRRASPGGRPPQTPPRGQEVPLGPVAGAAAPAVMFGLAIGGLSNWWTQQFYGPPSTWWWALQIAPAHRAPGYETYDTFQPAFLYQSLWDVAVGLGVIWAARRFPLSGVRTFMLCAACYTVGSFWVESVSVGPLPQVLGVRYGALGDIAVFLLAVAGLYLTRPRPIPPARTPGKSAPGTLVDDSPGDVIST
ncbi:MAG TPA: prolipoprotein diacylglyceryl transferase family protein [Streptosporangiaceae bacterium]|nr:prolipoprotein diacylglyceryl transferase family protein [Streptosporangiaceae bacterium]